MAQAQYDAQAYAQGIENAGEGIARGFRTVLELRMAEERLRQGNLIKIKDFMSLPAEKRQALLSDPAFRRDLLHTMSEHPLRKTKAGQTETPEQTAALTQLGTPTAEEAAKTGKAISEFQEAEAKRGLAEQKLRISTGVETPTPLSLLMAGDVKDPVAAALFSNIPQEQLTNIALADKKQGPLYQQSQQQEWFKWAIGEGLPPGVAMQTAAAISRGMWDKVPHTYTDYATGKTLPVRGKAEQQLAIDMMNARSRIQEIQNTFANNRATLAFKIASEAGLGMDQANANAAAMLAGKEVPFSTAAMRDSFAMAQILKSQEIEKNAQTILNDKFGITAVREALQTTLAQYRETGTFSGLDSGKLKDQIQSMQKDLVQRLGARYGVKIDETPSFWESTKKVMGRVWNGVVKPAGAFSADVIGAVDGVLKEEAETPGTGASAYQLGKFGTGPDMPKVQHTPDQEGVIRNLLSSTTAALGNEQVPLEQRKQLKKYMDEVLIPVAEGKRDFMSLFTKPDQEPF